MARSIGQCTIFRDESAGKIYVLSPLDEAFNDRIRFWVPEPKDRYYNPFKMTWVIDISYLDDITNLCKAWFGENNTRSNLQEDIPAVDASTKTPLDVFLSVFRLAGKTRADQTYRNLSRIFHPDMGGNGTLMTILNNARDQYQGEKH